MNITFTDTHGRIEGNLNPTLPTGDITINDEIIYDYKYANNNNITSVTFGSYVKYIGKSAFENCSNISSLDFSGASNLKFIDERAFRNCYYVGGNIDFSNTQLKAIGNDAFSYLSNSYGESSTTTINLGPCKVLCSNVFNGSYITTITAPSLEAVRGGNTFEIQYPNWTATMPNLQIIDGETGKYKTNSETTELDFRRIWPNVKALMGEFKIGDADNITSIIMPEDIRCMRPAAWPVEGPPAVKIYYFGHPVTLVENWGYDIQERMIYVPEEYLSEWENDQFWGQYRDHLVGYDPASI